MIRFESGDKRRGWVTAEQVNPGDVLISAHSEQQMEITDVVPVPHPREDTMIPALRGWANGVHEITDGRQLPGRHCGYRIGSMCDDIDYPATTTWSAQLSTGGVR